MAEHRRRYGFGDDLGMVSRFPVNHRVEPIVRVRRVLDDTARAVGLDERVFALDDVPGARLVLGLGVPSVPVLDVVGEAVLGVGVVGLLHVDGFGGVGNRGGSDGLGDGGGGVSEGGRRVGNGDGQGCGALRESCLGDAARVGNS